MDSEGFFRQRLGSLRADGRYRTFADLERRRGRFPRAFDHRIAAASQPALLSVYRRSL
jgi:hypothetical protein